MRYGRGQSSPRRWKKRSARLSTRLKARSRPAMAKLNEISAPRGEPQTLAQAVMEKLDRMENGEPDADLIPTGIIAIDTNSPLRKGDMPLISGERKSGKSIFSLTIAVNVAQRGVPVFSSPWRIGCPR